MTDRAARHGMVPPLLGEVQDEKRVFVIAAQVSEGMSEGDGLVQHIDHILRFVTPQGL